MQAHAAYRAIAKETGGVGILSELPLPELPHPQTQDRMLRDQLILDELPQVYFIASRILERLPPSVQIDDLVSAGVVGLIEAYENFNAQKNAQFKTFARFRIRGAILDSLRTLDWGTRGMRRKGREITEAVKRLENTLGRKPEKQEIANELKISLDQLETTMVQLDGLQVVGQQAFVATESGEVHDLIETAPSLDENPFDLCFKAEQRKYLAQAIATLNEREQLILSLYYKEELTMKETAEVVGIALSRVSQIHQTALTKLRTALAEFEKRPAAAPGIQLAASAARERSRQA